MSDTPRSTSASGMQVAHQATTIAVGVPGSTPPIPNFRLASIQTDEAEPDERTRGQQHVGRIGAAGAAALVAALTAGALAAGAADAADVADVADAAS